MLMALETLKPLKPLKAVGEEGVIPRQNYNEGTNN